MLRVRVPEATPSVLHGRQRPLGCGLEQAQPMLDLRQLQLELLNLVATHKAELREDPLHALARARSKSCGIAAPAGDRVVDHTTRVVAPHSTPLRELTGKLVDALGSQDDRADRSET